jgi:hypothetical protein
LRIRRKSENDYVLEFVKDFLKVLNIEKVENNTEKEEN